MPECWIVFAGARVCTRFFIFRLLELAHFSAVFFMKKLSNPPIYNFINMLSKKRTLRKLSRVSTVGGGSGAFRAKPPEAPRSELEAWTRNQGEEQGRPHGLRLLCRWLDSSRQRRQIKGGGARWIVLPSPPGIAN